MRQPCHPGMNVLPIQNATWHSGYRQATVSTPGKDSVSQGLKAIPTNLVTTRNNL